MSLEILMGIGGLVGTLLAVATLPGTIELLFLSMGSLLRGRRLSTANGVPPMRPSDPASPEVMLTRPFRLVVVVPAHNEETVIQRCLHSLYTCDKAGAEVAVVVVADNCRDRTTEYAAAAGARVLVRHQPEKSGKGPALAFAFDMLGREGFDAVVVIDADTVAEPNMIAAFLRLFAAGADAVQCRYGVLNPDASLRTRLMRMALLAFNVLRPRGRDWWGLSAGLLGNGFALTEATLRAVPYKAESVVEDLEYHLRLVQAGRRVRFADTTTVWAEMPTGGRGVRTQRTRWEGGRLRMMLELTPILVRGVVSGQTRLLEPLLDLLLLPVAFHVFLLGGVWLSPLPVTQLYALTGLGIVAFHLGVALYTGGGGRNDVLALVGVPLYMVWKLGMVGALLKGSKKDMAWVRTSREHASERKP